MAMRKQEKKAKATQHRKSAEHGSELKNKWESEYEKLCPCLPINAA
jgi:hypothetical protein